MNAPQELRIKLPKRNLDPPCGAAGDGGQPVLYTAISRRLPHERDARGAGEIALAWAEFVASAPKRRLVGRPPERTQPLLREA